jgi:hypothetical protein
MFRTVGILRTRRYSTPAELLGNLARLGDDLPEAACGRRRGGSILPRHAIRRRPARLLLQIRGYLVRHHPHSR